MTGLIAWPLLKWVFPKKGAKKGNIFFNIKLKLSTIHDYLSLFIEKK